MFNVDFSQFFVLFVLYFFFTLSLLFSSFLFFYSVWWKTFSELQLLELPYRPKSGLSMLSASVSTNSACSPHNLLLIPGWIRRAGGDDKKAVSYKPEPDASSLTQRCPCDDRIASAHAHVQA